MLHLNFVLWPLWIQTYMGKLNWLGTLVYYETAHKVLCFVRVDVETAGSIYKET
jgi:hypothetical protein